MFQGSRPLFQLFLLLSFLSIMKLVTRGAWRLFIDVIFMIWTHTEDELRTFITYLNNIQPTIKFTLSHSATSISFLDVKVSLSQFGVVETDLYTKPTDKHQYLLQSTCHPRHTKRAIPFSLALQL